MKTYAFKVKYNAIDTKDTTIHYVGRIVTIESDNVNVRFGEVETMAIEQIFKLGCTAVEITGIIKVED